MQNFHKKTDDEILTEVSTKQSENRIGLPPRPQKKNNIMLKTDSGFNKNKHVTIEVPKLATTPSHWRTSLKSFYKSNQDSQFDETIDSQERNELHMNQILNERDDKAEVREGISNTKGKLICVQKDHATREFVPIDQKTKIYQMMRGMRSQMKADKERKKALNDQIHGYIEIIDSEDEKERFDEKEHGFFMSNVSNHFFGSKSQAFRTTTANSTIIWDDQGK